MPLVADVFLAGYAGKLAADLSFQGVDAEWLNEPSRLPQGEL